MKKGIAGGLAALLLLLCLWSFDEQTLTPRQIIAARLHQRTDSLKAAIVQLEKAASGKPEKAMVRKTYLQLRKAYKNWEYLAEYLDPVFVKDGLNGAPLPKLERNSYGPLELVPRGLQVLDGLVYEEQPNGPEIAAEAAQMGEWMVGFNRPEVLYDYQVIEAARIALVRLFTLGLTGFDAAASKNSLPDAQWVIHTLLADLGLYGESLQRTEPKLASSISKSLAGLENYLQENKDFDRFDRLHVLKTFINPLYHDLLQAQKQLGIELPGERSSLPEAYNYNATNLFAEDFLEPFWYVSLPRSLYNDSLVALGRTLFFDPVLSGNGRRACASCHNPKKGFADGRAKSLAMDEQGTVMRNSPTLLNVVYNERFFHDLRAEALEDQTEHVIADRREFNTDYFVVAEKLRQSETYQRLFRKALPAIPDINKQSVAFALSAYVLSLRGFNSPFDRYVRGEIQSLPPAVKRGFNLFMGKAVCGTCHFAPVFNGTVPPLYKETESEILGVPENPYAKRLKLDADKGRAGGKLKENVPFYNFSFKTPTVRNVALTAPYMHNGAYKTLEDVVDLYEKGGGAGLGLQVPHQTLPFDRLQLSAQEKKDLVAFMQALTDTSGLTQSPASLPLFRDKPEWNARKVGGWY